MPDSRHPERGAEERRHDHDHRGAGRFGPPAALGADLGREVAGRDDDRNAIGDVIEHRRHHRFALTVGEDELLGEIRQDADSVGACIDHEVDGALLPLEIKLAFVVEDGGHDWKYAAIGACGTPADRGHVFSLPNC